MSGFGVARLCYSSNTYVMQSTNIPDGWLLFLYTLPAKNPAARVGLWRKLRKTGACALKISAYVLPDEPAHHERFQWLAKQVRDAGGEATLARVSSIEGLSADELAGRFNEARAEDYAEVTRALADILKTRAKRLAPEAADAVARLRRRFQEVREIDYFGCPAAHDAERLLARAEERADPTAAAATARATDGGALKTKDYAGRVWLTRPAPEIDRVGSAWLIRRFIDPRAEFVFAREARERPDAVPYDMSEGDFTHHGDDCTFETLLKRFAIADAGATRIGQMIHDADLEDEKFGRPECAGFDLVFKGWARLGLPDAEILEKGFICFEALHTALSGRAGRR
jgi:hypothetical protein